MKWQYGAGEDRRARHAQILRTSAVPDGEDLHRRQLGHDIEHELSTIAMLASTVVAAEDTGTESRRVATQILEEARWLSGLVRMYHDDLASAYGSAPEPIQVDQLAANVLEPLKLSSGTRLDLEANPVSAAVGRLELWRALRNVVLNAMAAAGPDGRVVVRVRAGEGCAVIEVEDDGPGCSPEDARRSALGLAIVDDFAIRAGGRLTIGIGSLGGALVRIELPATD